MKEKKSLFLYIISAVLLVLAVFFIVSASKASSANGLIKNAITEIGTEKEKVENDIAALNDKITETNKQKKALEKEIADLQSSVGDNQAYADIMDSIEEFMSSGKSHDSSKNVYAERNIVVLKKGTVDKIKVTISTYDTLYFNIADKTIAKGGFTDDWDLFTIPITLFGLKEGTTEMTISRKGSQDVFHVLLVVIP